MVEDCKKTARWGPKDQRVLQRCTEHRLATDEYRVYGNTCQHTFENDQGELEKCSKRAVYGVKGAEYPTRCSAHRRIRGTTNSDLKSRRNTQLLSSDDENVVYEMMLIQHDPNDDSVEKGTTDVHWYHGTCVEEGCNSVARYGYTKDGEALWCGTHTPESADITHMYYESALCDFVDAVSGNKCQVIAAFSDPDNDSGKLCAKHKKKDSKYLHDTQYCKHGGCETTASFGKYNEKTTSFDRDWCATHKKEDSIHFFYHRATLKSSGAPIDK